MTKISDEIIKEIAANVKTTLVKKHVAAKSGIHRDTIYSWFNKAEEDRKNGLKDTIHMRFADTYKEAQAAKVTEYISMIESRSPGWQAIAWLLERCFREDFGADAGIIQELLEKQNKLEALLSSKLEGNSNANT